MYGPYKGEGIFNRKCCWKSPDAGIIKHFKSPVLKMFKELKETMGKELKVWKWCPTKNINKENEFVGKSN